MNVNALYGESDAMTRLFELGQRRAEYEKSQKERTQYAATGAGSAYKMWAGEQAAQTAEMIASKHFTIKPSHQQAGFLKRITTPAGGRVDVAADAPAGTVAPKGFTPSSWAGGPGTLASGAMGLGEAWSLMGPEAKHMSDEKRAIKGAAALAHGAKAAGFMTGKAAETAVSSVLGGTAGGVVGAAVPWLGAGLSLWAALRD